MHGHREGQACGTEERATEAAENGAAEAVDDRCAGSWRAPEGDEGAVEPLGDEREGPPPAALRYLVDPRDVAEAAQEVFIRMHTRCPAMRRRRSPSASGSSASRANHAIDMLRREKHSRVEDVERLKPAARGGGGGLAGARRRVVEDERMALAVSSSPSISSGCCCSKFAFGFKSERSRAPRDEPRRGAPAAIAGTAPPRREHGERVTRFA